MVRLSCVFSGVGKMYVEIGQKRGVLAKRQES